MSPSNPSRKTRLEDLALVQRTKYERDSLPSIERQHRKLVDLRSFIRQLENSDAGKADLAARRRHFGDCLQQVDESNESYYGRLRDWVDKRLE